MEDFTEQSTLLPQNNQSNEWSLKSKVAGSLFTVAVLFSGVAVVNNKSSSTVTNSNSELLEGTHNEAVTHKLVAQRKGYDSIATHTLDVYSLSHVVEPDTTTILTVSTCQDCTDLTWSVAPLDTFGSVEYDISTTTNTLEAVFDAANSHYNVKVMKGSKTIVDETVTCKYVRRELRSINKADLRKYFKAVQIMYSTHQEEGVSLYGDHYLSYGHLVALHDSNVYYYHANLFFLTSHPVMQMKFEKSLLAIDKTIPLNYWDFLLDNKLGKNWAKSEIYDIDMFGAVATSPDDDYRPRGYFYNVKLVVDDVDATQFPRAQHTPHGTLGSGLLTTDSPYMQRSNSYCGFESIQGQVECTNLVKCFSDFESAHNLLEFDECLEIKVHANLHYMHAGQWDCQVSWGDFYSEHSNWLDESLFSIMALRMSSESLSRVGSAVYCPSTCTYGDDPTDKCECSSSLTGVGSPEEVHLLTKNTKYDLLKSTWEILATISYDGDNYVKFQDTFEFDGVTHHNVFVPIHTKNSDSGKIGEVLSDIQLDQLHTLMLQTILFPGSIGIMLSGAAPTDPLFWVMHPLFDKAVHALRLSSTYNSEGFDWNNEKGQMKYNGMTPFTHLDFEPYMTKVADPKLAVTNAEIWENIHPSAESVYYIYDQFTTWGDCDFDPFEYSDDGSD